ncbi:hypothetical protein DFH09DRAFT_1330334 [Mycena vulgaris]|nr:hypothetical protein DFH09DRAFT_1340741 [Mycena vulgaris]KAJ6522972.1 hypothetical protein DFH09DRAFT_1330334 [Mycena vulgaris]
MASTTAEIPYTGDDLKGKKPVLVGFVKRQEAKWPGPDVYSAKATTTKRLRAVLLDSRYGFTKQGALLEYAVEDQSVSTLSPAPTEKDPTPEPKINEETARTSPDPEGMAESADPPTHPSRWIKLFIEDIRGTSAGKISQELCLDMIDADDCEMGEWRADLPNLLVQLQESNSAITGSVRLSFRDPEQPEYWVPFVKVTDDALLEEALTFPEFVTIPRTGRLEIRVEHAEDLFFHTSPHHLIPAPGPSTSAALVQDVFDVHDPDAKPLVYARARAAKQTADGTRDNQTDRDTKWLTEQLHTTAGYQTFKDNQRKVQANPGVVASWKFIADFSTIHFGQVSRVAGRKKIQKKSIYKALGLGSTTLAEAENAARILNRYGQDGTNPAQAVLDRVARIDDPPKGARVLYPFLVQWDKDHRAVN